MKLFICLLALAAMSMAQESKVQKVFADANSQLTANFFNVAVKEEPEKSVVMSAYSVMQPLSLLALASEGESQTEIVRATGFSNVDAAKSVFPDADDQLSNIKGVTFKKANRIYIAEDAVLNPEFQETATRLFHSEVNNVDFSRSEQVSSEINNWVEQQTNNRIKDLVSPDSFDKGTRAVLVNAIYFKGKWKHQISPNNTKDADFRVRGVTKKVPMMHFESRLNYANVRELDSQEGDQASFVIVLPNKDDGLEALEAKLSDPSALPNALKQLRNQNVEVSLPKFKIESTWDLKELLQKLGVKRLFESGKADLKNLIKGESNLFISKAVQKAFIEVNEEGAEAAAANAFIDKRIARIVNTFVADRPFFFAIQDQANIIFHGVFYP